MLFRSPLPPLLNTSNLSGMGGHCFIPIITVHPSEVIPAAGSNRGNDGDAPTGSLSSPPLLSDCLFAPSPLWHPSLLSSLVALYVLSSLSAMKGCQHMFCHSMHFLLASMWNMDLGLSFGSGMGVHSVLSCIPYTHPTPCHHACYDGSGKQRLMPLSHPTSYHPQPHSTDTTLPGWAQREGSTPQGW